MMRRLRSVLAASAAIAVLGSAAMSGQALAQVAPPTASQQQQVIRLATSKGEQVAAVLTAPKDGININTPAIIHIHGGPGATPLDGSGPWIAEGLAGRGYTVVAPLARHGSHLYDFTFEAQNREIKAIVDYLSGLGFREIVLTGSSFGSISTTRYIVDTQDPRIKAAIHFAPTADMNSYTRSHMPPGAYEKIVTELSDMVSDGRGDVVVSRQFTHEARTWLEHWGPASDGVNSVLFKQIRVPMLLAVGDKDPFGSEPRMQELKAAAVNSPRVDTLFYAGGVDHSFYPKSTHPKVIADVAKWLVDVGMGPQPRTLTQVVTNHDDNKPGMQRALMYWPQTQTADKATFLFVNDWDNDALQGPNDRLASAVAAGGHPALVIQTQRGGYTSGNSYAASRNDLKGWIDWLTGQGAGKVVLVGPGVGATRVADYLATSGDKRVAGLVLISPAADNAGQMRQALGARRYAQMVSEARAAPKPTRTGPGPVGASSVPFMQFDAPAAQAGAPDKRYVLTPQAFLDTFGPDAPDLSRQLAQVKTPVLLAAGAGDDRLTEDAFGKYGGGARQTKWYPGAVDHDFTAHEAELSRDILAWVPKAR